MKCFLNYEITLSLFFVFQMQLFLLCNKMELYFNVVVFLIKILYLLF